jgi:flagellar protein FlbT
MNISLRRGEKIYINGAIFRVDRKVCIELLNDVSFLLENHVMQAADATTPLRQLYFVVQMMLMTPTERATPLSMYRDMASALRQATSDARILDGLTKVSELIDEDRLFDALKTTRALFPAEQEILGGGESAQQAKVA